MSPKTETILYRILTTIVYITSLFFVSYISADCYIDFRKSTIFINIVISVAATLCYLALHHMYYETDCKFNSNTDKWAVMFACVSVLMGIPMSCYILSLLIGIGVPK